MLIERKSIRTEYIKVYKLADKKIAIPIFQRFYSWNEKHIAPLIADLTECLYDRKDIFLLDFICYEEDDVIKLADGQQRLVTLNLLIKVINEHTDSRLYTVEPFDIFYDNVENNKKYQQAINNYMCAPFKKVYIRLTDFVKEHEEDIPKIIEAIQNRIYIYMVKTSSPDDAYAVFTQINTGGKPLSKDDVIHTALEQYSKIYNIRINAKAKNLRQTIYSFYKFKRENERGNFDTMAIMSFLKEYVIKDKSTFEEFSNAVSLTEKITSYAIYHIADYMSRKSLLDILNIMALSGIDIGKSRGYLTEVMLPLCLLSCVLSIKKGNPGGVIRSLFETVTNMIKAKEKPDKICENIAVFVDKEPELCKISLNEFTEALGKKEMPQKLKKALLLIDVIMRTVSGEPNVEKINLEHIYPLRPIPRWATEGGWPTNDDEKTSLADNIGNYLLLNEAINKSIKNKYITEKKIEYERIIPQDIMLQTRMNTVDFDKFEREKEKYIKERQCKIAESIQREYRLGNKIII